MKILSVIGTRPEIIKMAPLIWAVDKKFEQVIVHSGQHYDRLMSDVFIDQLKLPRVDLTVNSGSGTHAESTARMMVGIERAIAKEKPDIVLCPTDTNTSLATALASSKAGVFTIHVEAGCRSFDVTMPEEINRRMITHACDFHFASTKLCMKNLLREGIGRRSIELTGNPIVEAISFYKKSRPGTGIMKRLGVKSRQYSLMTFHRQENTDDLARARGIVEGVVESRAEIIFPVHPRTRRVLEKSGLMKKLSASRNIRLTEPLGYFEMLTLLENSSFLLTDSGGLQQEAYLLRVPSIVLRYNTEWYDIIEKGCGFLVGAEKEKIKEKAVYIRDNRRKMESLLRASGNIFGTNVSHKMVKAIGKIFDDGAYRRKHHDMLESGYCPKR